MIDHIGFAVADAETSAAFYAAALAPLGIKEMMRFGSGDPECSGTAIGFGKEHPFFWIGDKETVGAGTHVAFAAASRAAVDAFHAAALAAGGTDNGAPGLRPHYGPTCYAAFVHDPDGVNVEAVCHAPE
ncbi:VOC family protein [Sphingomonas sp. M1-B02]|uniref:VOC family protein n=1 Tax=Sphingomonas sp. M1-B02 TaxID=3114300 RepID=UPI002240A3D2|nr:VOC family protein [Sphingomonas sp. S6-11]UZK66838.1 VOC family protein [Sphingomonas sp. S6-11]